MGDVPYHPFMIADEKGRGTGMVIDKGAVADHMHSFLQGAFGNLLGSQTDTLVDDLHAGVPSLDGDLPCAVGVSVESRFTDKYLLINQPQSASPNVDKSNP